jgi:hypothetical protein
MDVAELRIICLNTVNPYGGWEGSLDAEQFRWLTSELQSTSRPVVIASHHPSATLTNAYAPLQAQPRVLGEQVLDLLHGFPQVVLWLAGHVHYHSMTRHVRGDHHFLEITTASMIDWPQQGRIIEILRTPATQGHRPQIVVVSTAMDHQAPIDPDLTSLRDHHNLASVSRLLSANDYHTHSAHSRMDAVNGWWEVPTA